MGDVLTKREIDQYRAAEAALRDAMTGPIDCDKLEAARRQMAKVEQDIRRDRDGRVDAVPDKR